MLTVALFASHYFCESGHTLVWNCRLISPLALVILIRVGGLLLRVMSVKSVSSPISFNMILFVVAVVFDLIYYCFSISSFLNVRYVVNLRYVAFSVTTLSNYDRKDTVRDLF